MPVIFDNPAGLWALLGLPALLLIHTLQARSRRTASSTLFLLERLAPESRGGWHWERLRGSVPLLLQLLAALVLAWLLVSPRWLREDASQQIVVVLDSSLSMEASLAETRSELPARLRSLEPLALRTEWTLLESDTRAPTLYRGENLSELAAVLQKWRPALGQHDAAPALQLAASLVRGAGAVIFVTDHAVEVPDGAALLSFAEPVSNIGFVGSTVEETADGTVWRALARNHGTVPRTLEWHLQVNGTDRKTAPEKLVLNPGETRVIGGIFPENDTGIIVSLTPDAFHLDDQLPLLRPAAKPVRVSLQLDDAARGMMERFLRGVPNIHPAGTAAEADLLIARRTPNETAGTSGKPAIIFPDAGAAGEKLDGWIVTDRHALVNDTGWQALLCAESAGIRPVAEDTALVWRGNTPLALLRQESPRPTSPVLLLNFDPEKTNAPRLPAFVVLLRRYIEDVRATLPVPFALNADTHQRIPLAYDPAQGELALNVDPASPVPLGPAQASIFRAPARAGFFQIRQNNQVLLNGAAQFSDVREADLSGCAPADTLAAREKLLAHAASVPDPYRPYWLALLLALPLLAWMAGRNRG